MTAQRPRPDMAQLADPASDPDATGPMHDARRMAGYEDLYDWPEPRLLDPATLGVIAAVLAGLALCAWLALDLWSLQSAALTTQVAEWRGWR